MAATRGRKASSKKSNCKNTKPANPMGKKTQGKSIKGGNCRCNPTSNRVSKARSPPKPIVTPKPAEQPETPKVFKSAEQTEIEELASILGNLKASDYSLSHLNVTLSTTPACPKCRRRFRITCYLSINVDRVLIMCLRCRVSSRKSHEKHRAAERAAKEAAEAAAASEAAKQRGCVETLMDAGDESEVKTKTTNTAKKGKSEQAGFTRAGLVVSVLPAAVCSLEAHAGGEFDRSLSQSTAAETEVETEIVLGPKLLSLIAILRAPLPRHLKAWTLPEDQIDPIILAGNEIKLKPIPSCGVVDLSETPDDPPHVALSTAPDLSLDANESDGGVMTPGYYDHSPSAALHDMNYDQGQAELLVTFNNDAAHHVHPVQADGCPYPSLESYNVGEDHDALAYSHPTPDSMDYASEGSVNTYPEIIGLGDALYGYSSPPFSQLGHDDIMDQCDEAHIGGLFSHEVWESIEHD
ncbi:hypothetical protein BJX64DRAFT_283583 [Aspergillus heterothallicus]